MLNSDIIHKNKSLQNKLLSIYDLRSSSRVNFEDLSIYKGLLNDLGNPQLKIPPTIHIAGTNGKGSTLAFIEQILKEMGKISHKYTSPHLIELNERIIINGQQISDDILEKSLDHILTVNNGRPSTFFEIITALAFYVFSKYPADMTLLETGLGGRLDCTNHVDSPIATIISAIAIDHTEFLGNTIEKIAKEKAGIIKKETPCIISPQDKLNYDSIINPIKTKARENKAPLVQHGSEWFIEPTHEHNMHFKYKDISYELPKPLYLQGDHQINNFGTALATIINISENNQSFLPNENQIINALKNTKWKGRMEKIYYPDLPKNIELYFDGGHNESAAIAIKEQIRTWQKEKNEIHLILGMMKPKNPKNFIKHIIDHINSINIIEITNDNTSYSHEEITEIINEISKINVKKTNNINELINSIENKQKTKILITGSFYLYNLIHNK